jgi:PhzF family phenazine biosynthesis protein
MIRTAEALTCPEAEAGSMKLPIYQVDAFTSRLFRGNPAAIVPLDAWLPDATLAAIAAENNLAETAFVIPGEANCPLRWFTPTVEVDLCGHATLATAHVLLTHYFPGRQSISFSTLSGTLTVTREQDRLRMDFPAKPGVPVDVIDQLAHALGRRPQEVLRARDLMAVFETESEVRALKPDMEKIMALDAFAVIVTAPGDSVDFVSRFFAPAKGVPEDPVTGSAHCTLIPYWAARLDKTLLHAKQVSLRGGDLFCELHDGRVSIAGQAVEYMRGEIFIADC